MKDQIVLFFAGDFCSTPSTTPIKVSDKLKNLISSSDFSVCNFEIPLKPDGLTAQKDRYYQADDAPAFLEGLGFNLFSFANNHAFDYGVEGWQKTMNAFQSKPFGSGTYEDAYKIKIVEKDGIKIGFLALCYAARFGVFDNLTDRQGYACAWIDDFCVNHIIIQAKREVDYLIVLPHDGIEYIDIPIPETIARYRDFIDYGADVVIGTHPHCPQGWEEYKGKPIFYSLGNFLFNSKNDYSYRATNRPHWYEGLCVRIIINDGVIKYDTINTLNEENLGISIDNRSVRNSHNEKLCNYLRDKELYGKVLVRECESLARVQEMPILDHTFHNDTLFSSFKQLVKFAIKKMVHKPLPNDTSLMNLLKNNTRRNLLLHSIKINHK